MRVQRQTAELAQDNVSTGFSVLFLGLQLEPVRYLGAGTGGGDKAIVAIEPVTAGRLFPRGKDLDLITGFERLVQGDDATVYLGASAAVAHFGMHTVGEVHGGSALRQVDHVAIGGEYINPILHHISAQHVAEGFGITQIVMPLQNLSQPGDLLFIAIAARLGVGTLVQMVGADAKFGFFVHGEGADLYFQYLAFRAEYGGMQRAVTVGLG